MKISDKDIEYYIKLYKMGWANFQAGIRNLLKQLYPDLWNRGGVYCIYVQDQPVYVGKSKELVFRLASHYFQIFHLPPTDHKYDVIQQAVKRWGKDCVSYEILSVSDDKDKIGYTEAYYINQYNPPLNIQIPSLKNYMLYKSRSINNITVDNLLKTPEARLEESLAKIDNWARKSII